MEFEHVYHQYFKSVYFFVLSLCDNEAVAEEITQETFFKALKSIDKFKGNCKISVWLCQIAKNTYFSYFDKQKKLYADEIPEEVSEISIEKMILRKEENIRIHRALHCLDEPYKEVFTLKVFGELSYGQISQLFEKTEVWARVTFHRAKQKIQDMIKEEKIND